MKFFTKPVLNRMNRKAIKLNLNRTLQKKRIDALPEDKVFPVSFVMLHNDDHIRARIILNNKGEFGELDMTFDDYERLPEVK